MRVETPDGDVVEIKRNDGEVYRIHGDRRASWCSHTRIVIVGIPAFVADRIPVVIAAAARCRRRVRSERYRTLPLRASPVWDFHPGVALLNSQFESGIRTRYRRLIRSLLYPMSYLRGTGRTRTCDLMALPPSALPLSYRPLLRQTACVPRHTHRHSRAHRTGFRNPCRCRTSFHLSRIDASRGSTNPLGGHAAEFLPCERKKKPRGQASRGRSLASGGRLNRPPHKFRSGQSDSATSRFAAIGARTIEPRKAVCCVKFTLSNRLVSWLESQGSTRRDCARARTIRALRAMMQEAAKYIFESVAPCGATCAIFDEWK